MKAVFKIVLACSALMLCTAAGAQTSDDKPAQEVGDVLAGSLPASSDDADTIPDADDTTDVVTIERDRNSSAVVCRWTRRNGSNFRERRCRTREQAAREERQADYALRRMTGF
jgi:hypothetical protein